MPEASASSSGQGEQTTTATTSSAQSQAAGASTSGPSSQPTTSQATTQAPARPDWLPESYWAEGKIKPEFGAHYNEVMARQAAEEVRRQSLPQTPDAYKVELPSDFRVPDGVTFKFNEADPLLAQAKTMAKEMGLGQEQFSKLLSLYAGTQVSTQQQVETARNAEIAKLGPTGPARIDALGRFFRATVGDAEGKQVMSRIFTASDVAVMEKLAARYATQGGAGFSRVGSEPPGAPGRLSDEAYAKLSASQKYDYSQQFDQSQVQRRAS
jgi:hypothetical protein